MHNLQELSGFMGGLTPSATLAIAAMAKALKQQGEDVVSMSAGEPDFDTPEVIKQACIDAINQGKVYYTPASGLMELKKALVEKFAKDNGIATAPERIVIAPGAKFSVFSAVAALCGPGDEVIIPAPYWLSYPEMVKATGAKVVPIMTTAENNYELDPAELEARITSHTKLLILNTPSNPTGAVYRKSTLEKIAEVAVRKNIMILSDEIYEKLVYDKDFPHVSIASLNDRVADITVTANGFSKTYSMTGWRLGYLTAPLWLAKRIIAFQSHSTSNPTTFVQWAGITALREAGEDVEKMRKAFSHRRDLIYRLVSEIDGIKTHRPQGAFYLFCDVSSFGLSADDFCKELLEKELLAVVPGTGFSAPESIRLSYACSENNIYEAVKRLSNFCTSLRKRG